MPRSEHFKNQVGPQITREQAERLIAFSRGIPHLDGPPILKERRSNKMLKKWIWAAIAAFALLTATGASGIVADSLGLDTTPHAAACDEPGGSDGC